MSNGQLFISLSLEVTDVHDFEKIFEICSKNGYSSITSPMVSSQFRRELLKSPIKEKHTKFTRSELVLTSNQWLNKVICRLSDNVDCDSQSEKVRRISEKTIRQEIQYAEHLVQHGYIIMKLKSEKCANTARTVCQNLKGTLLIEVPLLNMKFIRNGNRRDAGDENFSDTWKWWNNFRCYADYNPLLKVALELTTDIPPTTDLRRWMGEPVDTLIISSNLFLTNSKNYPVLSRAHQDLITHLYNVHSCNFIVKANQNDNRLNLYAEYLKYLVTHYNFKDPMRGYEDLLEIPLQPLYDNLDSFTYEIFEKDPVKYIAYQKAIEAALIDKVPEDKIADKTVILMVVGGGRGPLVKAALNASANTNRKMKVYVIEKNPNAIITLAALISELWQDKDVELISKDMREFEPPEKADIIVSELLGSFGDNELSPECLDGAQRHLKPDGISIPCQSTSYINPCFATKVFNQVRVLEKAAHSKDRIVTSHTMEGNYVAYLKNVYHVADPLDVFTFVHPNKDEVIDNTRYKVMKFPIKQDCVIHGFCGYFDTVLYKDIILSIHPFTHTKGLSSWFSIFFPLTEPQQLKEGDVLEVHMWRCVSSHKVWYEWLTVSPHKTHVHNYLGRANQIWL